MNKEALEFLSLTASAPGPSRPAASTSGKAHPSVAQADWAVLKIEDTPIVQTAVRFAQVTRRHQSQVWVSRGGETADAKSPLELLALGDVEGLVIHLRAVGPDAQNVLSDLEGLLGPSLVPAFRPATKER